MKKFVSGMIVLALLSGAGLGVYAYAAPANDKVLAKVDGENITQGDLNLILEELGSKLSGAGEKESREFAMNFLIDLRIASKSAAARKMNESDDFKNRLELAKQKVLMDMLMNEARSKVSDADKKRVFEEAQKKMTPSEEVRARHILVATEAEAKDVKARLGKGEDFAKLADEVSKDKGSANGGDLGYFTKDRMVPEFSEAAFNLKKGDVSGPVKSAFGWHIIKVEDKRMSKGPDFDAVKEQITQYLENKAVQDNIVKMRESVKIERLDAPAVEQKGAK